MTIRYIEKGREYVEKNIRMFDVSPAGRFYNKKLRICMIFNNHKTKVVLADFIDGGCSKSEHEDDKIV